VHVLTQNTPGVRARVQLHREVVSPETIAGALEHRLFRPEVDLGQLKRGCDYAAEAGVAAVLCRPEHVAPAARRLLDSLTVTVTALAFHQETRLQEPADLAAEGLELVAAGASEVALIVAPGLDRHGCLQLIAEQVDAVLEAVTPQGGRVRVLLNTTDMSKDQVTECTALVGARGPTLVQGGSFRGDRATFSQIESMRDALPSEVLLKWTQPLRSVEMMLVSMALGINRFNGDIPALLDSAKRSTQIAPLMLPVYGVDF
jgi:deoxyribose-phosphate aldolase